MIQDVHSGSRIRIFFPTLIRIPDPGVKKAPDPGSATLPTTFQIAEVINRTARVKNKKF
jgi:hypothetical protein